VSAERPIERPPFTRTILLLAILACITFAGSCQPADDNPDVNPTADLPGALRLVGHEPLFARGMNAGIAVWRGHVYVGSRSDGAPGHRHPGVLVVDAADPGKPRVVGEIGRPSEGNIGETSRELRIWRREGLLLVLNFACDPAIHACTPREVEPTVRFYDVRGAHATSPELVSTYRPSALPHEFFLWQDPRDPPRALLYMSALGPAGDQLLVTDISAAREGRFAEVASWATSFPDPGPDDTLHSVSVTSDGHVALLAHLTAGFLLVDTSELAEGAAHPRIRTLTTLATRPQWPGPGVHSAVPVPGTELALTTDEVYGASVGGGCPWGWVRLIDITDPGRPTVVSEYRARPYNELDYCDVVGYERNMNSSFSSHNPTVTPNLALISWHSAGLQVISIDDPRRPLQVAEFLPEPLPEVATEDPVLSSGSDKVVMWSYPIVVDGLIYVVDVRNGLYILAYDGPHDEEIDGAAFLEGNSNIGSLELEESAV
jgi:hypothetical protein